MCDKEIEVIDLTLCGSSDEEEDPVKNLKASCSSPVLISSDLELEDFEPAFEYVYNFLFLVKLADSISCLHFTCYYRSEMEDPVPCPPCRTFDTE